MLNKDKPILIFHPLNIVKQPNYFVTSCVVYVIHASKSPPTFHFTTTTWAYNLYSHVLELNNYVSHT